jgi:rhodanese-related sulfurtransferase
MEDKRKMTKCISGQSSMQEVLDCYPSAQRTLHKEYHIGGCSKCGFDVSDTLEAVLLSRKITDVDGVITKIKDADDIQRQMTISVEEVNKLMQSNENFHLIDVRETEEWSAANIEGSQLLTRELVKEMVTDWSKDEKIVFFCHTGNRSMEAASYFIEQGFTSVHSMDGGIDLWSRKIDPAVPQYKIDQFMGVVTV